MRRCGCCGLEKPDDQFHVRTSTCKSCKKKIDARSHQRHRKARVEKRRRDRAVAREWFETLKAGKKCVDCKIAHPTWRMDWDHLPGSEKLFEIGDMSHKGIGESGRRKILEEIAKCELVCANCHRDRTHNRRQEKRINVHSH